jgi:predicted amidohydrolase
MSKEVKIAGVQMGPRMLETGHNLSRCLGAIKTAAEKGARLIIFPECALSGYVFSSLEEAFPAAEPIPGPSTEKIIAACRELRVTVVIGLLEKEDDKCYNAAVLLDRGGLVGKHRKAHLPVLGVDRFVDHGDLPFSVYETEVGKIGMGICWEVLFPEHARVLALQGAEIIALPTNWPEGTEFMPELFVPARALENRIYFAAVNRVGEERGFKFFGRSRITHPFGTILADGKGYEEDILYAEIRPAQARRKCAVAIPGEYEAHFFSERRPELYGLIAQPVNERLRTR